MSRRALRTLFLSLFAAAAFLAVLQVVSRWPEVERAFEAVEWDPDPLLLGLSVLLLVAGLAANPAGWAMVARDLGAGTPVRRLLAAWFASQLGRYIPGKVWLFAGRIGFLRSEGLSLGRSAGAAVWEVLLGFASVGAVSLPCLALAGPGILPGSVHAAVMTASAALAALPLLVPVQRLAFRLKGVEGFTGVRGGTALRAVLVYSAAWLARGASTWLWLEGLGLTPASFPAAVASAPLAWLAGYIVVFVPGGIGVREAVTAAICMGGVMFAPAAAAVFGQTLVMALAEVVLAVVWMRLAAAGRRGADA